MRVRSFTSMLTFPLAVLLSGLLMGLFLSPPSVAGGPPSFSFDSPPSAPAAARAAAGPAAPNPVLIVHAYSCHAPTDAAVVAHAEGVVNGKRKTIPLKLEGTGATGVYAVARQWPAEGSWALVFSVDRGGQTTALVKLDAKGMPMFTPSSGGAGSQLEADSLRTISGKAKEQDIDSVLVAQLAR